MRSFIFHDYGPGRRVIAWETSIGQQRSDNIHAGDGRTREDFIEFRTERDAQLSMPKLIIPSLQVDMRAGQIPCDDSGKPMLKVPVNGT